MNRLAVFCGSVLVSGCLRTAAGTSPEANLERLLEFMQSPPPIREMVVECQWYRYTGGTDTNWIALCWQPDGYILRASTARVELHGLFDTNRDRLITVRAGEEYAAVLDAKVLGVHIERVVGRENAGSREVVTPKIRGQEVYAAHAFTLGFPVDFGTTVSAEDGFYHLHKRQGASITAAPELDERGRLRSCRLAYQASERPLGRGFGDRVFGRMAFHYGPGSIPEWFPQEIVRDRLQDGRWVRVCRLVTHRLELGCVSPDGFRPERFLPRPSVAAVSTSNGVSYLTYRGSTRGMLDPRDPDARGIQTDVRGHRALYGALVLLLALGSVAIAIRHRRRSG
jgi:hypothetical protein